MFIAAPSPVDRPHANRQARSSGASREIRASAISGMTVYSANVDVPMKCRTGSPPNLRSLCFQPARAFSISARISESKMPMFTANSTVTITRRPIY